ncbi:flippase-like domain-containing protein [Candidatus Saccharibacteria bacterium]|nr:flippase-like domain-containing protein [Candidatus Saccharibacteria bacterium]MCA9328490.1 flippase-like domain-containing protein [Candidatus Saccharibacteria bacterium]
MNLKSIKFWINAVTIFALVLLVVFARAQIIEAFKTFARLNLLWLVLVIPVQLTNHFSVAKFYQSYLKTMGEKIRTSELFKVSLEMNFVNNVFPSGGVSGFGYLGIRMRKLGVKGSKATLLQTSRHFLTFVSFMFYLLIAVLLLSVFGSASRVIVLIASSLSSIIVFSTLFLVYVISNEDRIKQFTAALPKLINAVVSVFHRNKKQTINIDRIEDLFGDLHKDYKHVRKNWKDLRYPLFWTMLMNFTEILTIVIVYASFGQFINPGAIIIAYAVANMAGLVAVLPGGVGVYEGLMTGVMASAGIDEALALSATVVYRVFNMGLFLPIGYVFYQRALRTESGHEIENMLEEAAEHDPTNI